MGKIAKVQTKTETTIKQSIGPTDWNKRLHVKKYWIRIRELVVEPYIKHFKQSGKSTAKGIPSKIIEDEASISKVIKRFVKDGDSEGSFRRNLENENKKIKSILRSLTLKITIPCKCLESLVRHNHEDYYFQKAEQDAPFWFTRICSLLKPYVTKRILNHFTIARSRNEVRRIQNDPQSHDVIDTNDNDVSKKAAHNNDQKVFNDEVKLIPFIKKKSIIKTFVKFNSPAVPVVSFKNIDLDLWKNLDAVLFSDDSDLLFVENQASYSSSGDDKPQSSDIIVMNDDGGERRVPEFVDIHSNDDPCGDVEMERISSSSTSNTQQIHHYHPQISETTQDSKSSDSSEILRQYAVIFAMIKINTIDLAVDSIGPIPGFIGYFAKCNSVTVIIVEFLTRFGKANPCVIAMIPRFGTPEEHQERIKEVVENFSKNLTKDGITLLGIVADAAPENKIVGCHLIRAICHLVSQGCFDVTPKDGNEFYYDGCKVNIKELKSYSRTFYGKKSEMTTLLEEFWDFGSHKSENLNFGFLAKMPVEFFKILFNKIELNPPKRDPQKKMRFLKALIKFVGVLKDLCEDLKFDKLMDKDKCKIYQQHLTFLSRFEFKKNDFLEELIKTLKSLVYFYCLKEITFEVSLYSIKIIYELHEVARQYANHLPNLNQLHRSCAIHHDCYVNSASCFGPRRTIKYDPLPKHLRFYNGNELLEYNIKATPMPIITQDHTNRAQLKFSLLPYFDFEDEESEDYYKRFIAEYLAIKELFNKKDKMAVLYIENLTKDFEQAILWAFD